MTEWTVVTVIAVLAGLLGAIIKPIIRLNTTLTKLTESVNALEKNIAAMNDKNGEAHEKLWRKSDEHEQRLSRHETRLGILEQYRQ
jgi:predicted  nucleic acid-binding Zn-ribbon protein